MILPSSGARALLEVIGVRAINWLSLYTSQSKAIKWISVLTRFGLGGEGKMAPLRVFAKYLKNSLANLHETL